MDGGVLCALIIAGLALYLIISSSERANNSYRMHCGECRYRTNWLAQSVAEADHEKHYATRHPGIEPGGQVEIRNR